MHRTKLLAPLALLVVLTACTDPAKEPASQAIQGTEATLAAVRAEGAKYAPTQLKAVEDGLAFAKAAFAKGDFKAALAAAKDLPAQAKAVGTAAATGRDAEGRDFAMATAQLPQLLDTIQGRIAELTFSKKLPKGIDATTLASAKDGVAAVRKVLDEATAKATNGKMAEALAEAKPLRAKSLAIAASLGLGFGGAPAK